MPIELSIILPAFNEENEIKENVLVLKEHMDQMHIAYEIILVNDGSRDQTLLKMKECAGEHIKIFSYDQNMGKGYAVKYGMLQSHGTYALFMDVDLSTSLDSIENFLNEMRQGQWDVLIGERKSKYRQQVVKQPWYRRFLGHGFTMLSCLCVGRSIIDFTCGFKMFNRRAAEIIFKKQKINNWSFDAELICIAIAQHLRMKEMPVVWRHHPKSNVRVLKDMGTSLMGLMKIKWYSLRGLYS